MTITVLNKGERMSILSIKNISKFYTLDGKHQEQALKNINLQIAKGKITAIYGPSGCGKTSLLNIISGLDRQYEGVLEFKGESLRDLSEIELTQFRKDKIGFVFQNFKLIQNNTILENVSIPLIYNGMSSKDRKAKVLKGLEDVGLHQKEDLLPNKLSGGQQQRVAIARAIINEPKFIIADEPTGALDSKTSKDIMDLFVSLNKEKGTTMIMVTHDREVANKADRIIHILDGRVKEEEVLTHE